MKSQRNKKSTGGQYRRELVAYGLIIIAEMIFGMLLLALILGIL